MAKKLFISDKGIITHNLGMYSAMSFTEMREHLRLLESQVKKKTDGWKDLDVKFALCVGKHTPNARRFKEPYFVESSVMFKGRRPETDKEFADRVKKRSLRESTERQTLAMLKKKYEPEDD